MYFHMASGTHQRNIYSDYTLCKCMHDICTCIDFITKREREYEKRLGMS